MIRSSGDIAQVVGEWECMECGYIEEGVDGRRPKRCPECDAPPSALEFFPDEDDLGRDRAVGEEFEDEDLDEYGEGKAEEYDEEES
jgi:hypothetical protein